LIAIDDKKKAIVASVSGTGLWTDAGSIADYLADANANFYFGLECPILKRQGLNLITFLPGKYHRGFCWYYNMMLLYTSYETELMEAVKAYPDYDVVFTGHSLGGAAITIAAADYLHRIRPKLTSRWLKHSEAPNMAACEGPCWEVAAEEPQGMVGAAVKATGMVMLYTYGAPRAGNPTAANYLHKNLDATFRVTRNGDPIPLLMFCQRQDLPKHSQWQACNPVDWNPYHQGVEVYYPNYPNGTYEDKYYICNGLGEDPECAASRPVETKYTLQEIAYGFVNIHTAYFGQGPTQVPDKTKMWCCGDSE